MVITDVGQTRIEELNYLPLAKLAWGGNFGWKIFEGTLRYNCDQVCPNGALLPIPTPLTLAPAHLFPHGRLRDHRRPGGR